MRDGARGHSRMLEIEISGLRRGRGVPSAATIVGLCELALASAGIAEGHLAIELVGEQRIAELNARHRGRCGPTDVLSFPVDLDQACPGPRELGDVVVCPERASSITESIVHGVLHLCGMDHEVDEGEMLCVQSELLRWEAMDAESLAASG
jgi:probable rRNA maturation factor